MRTSVLSVFPFLKRKWFVVRVSIIIVAAFFCYKNHLFRYSSIHFRVKYRHYNNKWQKIDILTHTHTQKREVELVNVLPCSWNSSSVFPFTVLMTFCKMVVLNLKSSISLYVKPMSLILLSTLLNSFNKGKPFHLIFVVRVGIHLCVKSKTEKI